MSPTLASLLGIGIYSVALAPVLWVAVRPHAQLAIAGYFACLLGVAALQTGLFQQTTLTRTEGIAQAVATADEAQCRQIRKAMEDANISVDLSDPVAPKLIGAGTASIPEQVRAALLQCFQNPAAAPASIPVAPL